MIDTEELKKAMKIKSKMSKNDLRAISIISLTAGIAVYMERHYSNDETEDLLGNLGVMVIKALHEWPGEVGEREMARAAMAFAIWEGKIPEDTGMLMLTHVNITLITDLLDLLKNKKKISLATPILEASQRVMEWVDFSDKNYEAYEAADALVEELYSYFN